MTEYIDIVNENDEIIGKAAREDVVKKKLLHRTVTVIVKNSKGDYVLTKRASGVDAYPEFLDARAAGRVTSGESYEGSAARELEEELGISGVDLEFLFKQEYKDKEFHCFRKVFLCIWDGPLKVQEEEVEWAKFVSLEEIKEAMTREDFVSPGKDAFEKYLEYING